MHLNSDSESFVYRFICSVLFICSLKGSVQFSSFSEWFIKLIHTDSFCEADSLKELALKSHS